MTEIIKEVRNHVLWITINRKEQRNALNTEIMHEIAAAVSSARDNTSLRAIAAPHAKFGLPEVKVGVFPMQVLAALQGKVPAIELNRMCLTGS